jgi:hypothetical protein
VNQTNHFFDLGYGWLCKHCSAEDAERKQHPEIHASLQNHNKPEQNQAKSSGLALARWTSPAHQALTCPRCGIEETVSKA